MSAMKKDLLGKRKFDGALITSLEPNSDCATVFTAGQRKTEIHWGKLDNPTAYSKEGQEVLPLTDVHGGKHTLEIGSGHDAQGVTASVTLLYFDCQPS